MSLAACTGTQAPFTEREVQELKNRTVPNTSQLVATSRPVKNDFGFHATWDTETSSDNQAYFQWLKTQLTPEYHVTAGTASTITFVKETRGDSYSLEFSGNTTSGRSVVRATFTALAD